MSEEQHRNGGGGDPAAVSNSGDTREGPRILGPGKEFDLIRGFFRAGVEERGDVLVGVGDDAAVVTGNGIVLSSDLSVEGVHFRRDWLTASEIGYRAATAALSDLAAMAARPIGVLVSLALPDEDVPEFATSLMTGVRSAASRVGAAIIGGDVTRSQAQVVVDVVVVGEAERPVLRSGAKPGDELWVTGTLGAAALAVEAMVGGKPTASSAWDRFRSPVARTREALWLAERGLPRAMLDLSDGLAGDAAHMAAASGVCVVLDQAAVPVHDIVARTLPPGEALRLALSGGEDYELLFAARPGEVEESVASFEKAFGCALRRVGSAGEGEGVFIRERSGAVRPLGAGGFQHFRDRP